MSIQIHLRAGYPALLPAVFAAGLAAQPLLLKDLTPGPLGSGPDAFVPVRAGAVVFQAADASGRRRALYRTDGTASGTRMLPLAAIVPDHPFYLGPQGEGALVVGRNATQVGLFYTEGTSGAGTRFLGPVPAPGTPFRSRFVSWRGHSYFLTSDQKVASLVRSDGTAAGTVVVRTFPRTGPQGFGLYPGSERLFFTMFGNIRGELWSTNGTAAGTVRASVLSVPPVSIATAGRWIYYQLFAQSGLMRSDGTAAGTTQIDVVRGAFAALGEGILYSSMAQGLRRYDDNNPGGVRIASPGFARFLIAASGRVFFHVNTGVGNVGHLWVTDGTAAGTRRIRQNVRFGQFWQTVGNDLVFSNEEGGDTEPWFSDGTAANTRRIADIAPGIASSTPGRFHVVDMASGPVILFVARDPAHGEEPRILPVRALGSALLLRVRAGCARAGQPPALRPFGGLPRVGSTGFGLDIRTAPRTTIALVASVGLGAPLGGCHWLHPAGVFLVGTTDASGQFRQRIPIPAQAALVGVRIYAQGLVARRGGALLTVADVSDTMAITVGR